MAFHSDFIFDYDLRLPLGIFIVSFRFFAKRLCPRYVSLSTVLCFVSTLKVFDILFEQRSPIAANNFPFPASL